MHVEIFLQNSWHKKSGQRPLLSTTFLETRTGIQYLPAKLNYEHQIHQILR